MYFDFSFTDENFLFKFKYITKKKPPSISKCITIDSSTTKTLFLRARVPIISPHPIRFGEFGKKGKQMGTTVVLL